MPDLTGKVALVTGTTGTMGQAIAGRLAQDGASVVGCGRRRDAGEAHAQALRDKGFQASFLAADVGVESDVQAVVQHALDTFGHVDIVVNNAAATDVVKTGQETGVLAETTQNFETMMRVGVTGPFYFFKHAGAVMRSGGAFVSISSLSGSQASPGMPGYSASKAGLEGLNRAAASDLAPRGIRANVLTIGFVRNPENAYALEHPIFGPALKAMTILPHIGEPEDVASFVAYLASDEARFVNATVLTLDGGAAVKVPLPPHEAAPHHE